MMQIPRELRRSLHSIYGEFVDPRIVIPMNIFLLGLLFYIFSGQPYGWSRYIPPFLGPLITAAFFALRPFNPYKGLYASRMGIEMDNILSDAAAQKLVQILRSREARLRTVVIGIALGPTLSLVTLALSQFRKAPRSWEFLWFEVLCYSFLCAGLTGYVFFFLVYRWAFRRWLQWALQESDTS